MTMYVKSIAIFLMSIIISSCGSSSSNKNTAPEIIGITSFSVDENTIAVSTFTATDAQDDPISYFVDGLDSGFFTIGSSSGALVFNNAPDYENPQDSNEDNVYELSIGASDGSFSSSLGITVSINNIDENPLAVISVDQQSVSTYSQITLTWECLRSLSADAEDGWTGSKSLSGSESIYLSTAGVKTFTLKCSNDAGTTSSSVDVNVDDIVLKNVPEIISLFKDE